MKKENRIVISEPIVGWASVFLSGYQFNSKKKQDCHLPISTAMDPFFIEELIDRLTKTIQDGDDTVIRLDAEGNYSFIVFTAINIIVVKEAKKRETYFFDSIGPKEFAESFIENFEVEKEEWHQDYVNGLIDDGNKDIVEEWWNNVLKKYEILKDLVIRQNKRDK